MRDFKQFCIEENRALDNIFGDLFPDAEEVKEKIRKRGKAVDQQRKVEPYKIPLYRGFNADLSSLKKQGNQYVLSPKRSEQGMLWFTHPFIRGYDAVEYAKGKGDLLLTYPLQAKKIYDQITYEDGSTKIEAPKEIFSKVDPTENSPYLCMWDYCIELPKGWFWTYKSEKFIGTTNEILVTPDMIKAIT